MIGSLTVHMSHTVVMHDGEVHVHTFGPTAFSIYPSHKHSYDVHHQLFTQDAIRGLVVPLEGECVSSQYFSKSSVHFHKHIKEDKQVISMQCKKLII